MDGLMADGELRCGVRGWSRDENQARSDIPQLVVGKWRSR